ncbi:hypothetical protein LTR56_023450 [Elasticomyces elasticus]|nr:hypothetical protein LTR56_023450 [Elasticomyces elasticus]KAK4919749.1 hypothetical protein LTR49_012652 [Elasticomyces elasticus]
MQEAMQGKINDTQSQAAIARDLAITSRTTGRTALVNHGVDIQKMLNVARDLFDLPPNEQARFQLKDFDGMVGFERSGPGVDLLWLSGRAFWVPKERLPLKVQASLSEIDSFKHSCEQLAHRLLVYFSIALGHNDDQYFPKLFEKPGSNVQFRIRRYSPDSTGSTGTSATVWHWVPASFTGSITFGFVSAGGMELETADGKWRVVHEGKDAVFTYLGDVVPLWSRSHSRRIKFRFVWPKEVLGTERFSMMYQMATSVDTTFKSARD